MLIDTINEVELSGYDCSEETFVSDLREDIVLPSSPVSEILRNAPESKDNFFSS